jgi:hypothetical protein
LINSAAFIIDQQKRITAAFLSKENRQSPFKNILLQLQDRFCVVDGGRSETIGFFVQQCPRPTFRELKGLMRPIFSFWLAVRLKSLFLSERMGEYEWGWVCGWWSLEDGQAITKHENQFRFL